MILFIISTFTYFYFRFKNYFVNIKNKGISNYFLFFFGVLYCQTTTLFMYYKEINYKSNYLLNNDVTFVLNSTYFNSCYSNYDKYKFIKSVFNINCYYDKYMNEYSKAKILYLSLIDKNGGLMDFFNQEKLIKIIDNISVEDKIYIYQKAFEGLVEKNNKFKSQKYYDKEKPLHNFTDKILETEKIFYEKSKSLSTTDFIDFINESMKDNYSIIANYLIYENKKAIQKVKMSDLKEVEELYRNQKI